MSENVKFSPTYGILNNVFNMNFIEMLRNYSSYKNWQMIYNLDFIMSRALYLKDFST
jgi:hypothetical protein